MPAIIPRAGGSIPRAGGSEIPCATVADLLKKSFRFLGMPTRAVMSPFPTAPRPGYNLLTVLVLWFVTQMLVPSKATPTGVVPTV
jgi:hypothetical protein